MPQILDFQLKMPMILDGRAAEGRHLSQSLRLPHHRVQGGEGVQHAGDVALPEVQLARLLQRLVPHLDPNDGTPNELLWDRRAHIARAAPGVGYPFAKSFEKYSCHFICLLTENFSPWNAPSVSAFAQSPVCETLKAPRFGL